MHSLGAVLVSGRWKARRAQALLWLRTFLAGIELLALVQQLDGILDAALRDSWGSLVVICTPDKHSPEDLIKAIDQETRDVTRPLHNALTMLVGGTAIVGHARTTHLQMKADVENKDVLTSLAE